MILRPYRKCVIFVSLATVATVVALAITSIIVSRDSIPIRRYAINIEDKALGYIEFDKRENAIRWKLQVANLTALHIYGPKVLEPADDPFLLSLCGAPSLLDCSLEDEIFEITDISYHAAISPKNAIYDIVDDPPVYSLQIRTTTHPDGELQQQFDRFV